MKDIISIKFPPFFDIQFGNSYESLNFSQYDFDWSFFYYYVGAKMKDIILEVRPSNTSLGLY